MMATNLIGRAGDLERIHALIDAGERLITLWGPAGVGKTSLARACATPTTPFVDLTAARDWSGVMTTVADVLGAPLPQCSGPKAIEHLARVVAARGRVLIVLDNFEQVVADSAAPLGAWSTLCPQATFLVTSREKLLLGAEVIHEVTPLAPRAASELFVARALAAGHASIAEDAPAIEEIVRQLDGLPLAIELAAAQMPVLGAAELVARLPLLEIFDGGRRDVDARHRTLRGALDWSWRMLGGEEQVALAEISVFRGGFTLAAAEATLSCGAANVLPTLRSLHRRALVQARRTEGGEVRYSLLFEVRAFAAERLAAMGEAGVSMRARHATYFVEAATRWASEARRGHSADRWRHLSIERENLIGAHGFSTSGAPENALRIALALEPLLLLRGPLSLLARLVDEVTTTEAEVAPALLGRALCARALAAWRQGEAACALAEFDRALAIARRISDRHLEAVVLNERGRSVTEQSLSKAAVVQLEDALALAVSVGDRDLECEVLANLGHAMWYDGQFAAAEAFFLRARPLSRASANPALEGRVLAQLAFLALDRGRPEEAMPDLEIARTLFRRAGNHRYAAILTMDLAIGASDLGRIEEADALFAEALGTLREAGDSVGEGHCLANIGWEEIRHRRGLGRAHFERALVVLEGAGIGWAEGLICATLAAIEATEDNIDAARVMMARARRGMETVGDLRLHDAARMHYLHVDLALARRARLDGDDALAARLHAEVSAHLAQCSSEPDDERSDCRFARLFLERALAGELRAGEAAVPANALLVAREATAFRAPGHVWVDLSRHKVLRRILSALVHREHLTVDELLQEAWPDERVSPRSGASRVHVGVATLRRLGLGALLARGPKGYYLDRSIPIVTDVLPDVR